MSKSVECEKYVKVTGSKCVIGVYTEDNFYARFDTHKGGDAVLANRSVSFLQRNALFHVHRFGKVTEA